MTALKTFVAFVVFHKLIDQTSFRRLHYGGSVALVQRLLRALKPRAEAVRMTESSREQAQPDWKLKQEVKPAEDRETVSPPGSTQAAEKRYLVLPGRRRGDCTPTCVSTGAHTPNARTNAHSLTCACGHQLLKASSQCPRFFCLKHVLILSLMYLSVPVHPEQTLRSSLQTDTHTHVLMRRFNTQGAAEPLCLQMLQTSACHLVWKRAQEVMYPQQER